MTRQEYLDALEQGLKKLSADEQESAVSFYKEYFDEAGDDDAVIESLGAPSKLAAQITADAFAKSLENGGKASDSYNESQNDSYPGVDRAAEYPSYTSSYAPGGTTASQAGSYNPGNTGSYSSSANGTGVTGSNTSFDNAVYNSNTGNSGNAANTSYAANAGNIGNAANAGYAANTGNSGNAANTGYAANTGNNGNTENSPYQGQYQTYDNRSASQNPGYPASGSVGGQPYYNPAPYEGAKKSRVSAIWYIVLGILALPVGLPILAAVFAIIAALLAVCFGVVVSLIAVIIGLVATAGGIVVFGVMGLSTVLSPLMTAGCVLVALGAAFVFIPAIVKLIAWIVRSVSKILASIFNKLRGGNTI